VDRGGGGSTAVEIIPILDWMKHLLWMAVLLLACGKKDSDKAPATDTTPTAPQPSAETTAETTAAPQPPSGPCTITITVHASTLSFAGNGASGETPLVDTADPDLASLDPHRSCGAQVLADKEVTYRSIIHVIDSLTRHGFADISVGAGTRTPAHVEEPGQDLSKAPVIVMSTTTVTVAGSDLAKSPTDPELGKAIEMALAAKGKPSDPRVILQADASLPAAGVMAAIEAARRAGYGDVLFAVKKK
jgi:biopolymer transport protein ExbD